MQEKFLQADWHTFTHALAEKGYAILPGILDSTECRELIDQYDAPSLYRKTVVMERYRFGAGEYKYFTYPLPNLLQELRTRLYPRLVPIANRWMKDLHMDQVFPDTLQQMLAICHAQGQHKPTALILKYWPGGFNTLHQDLYGDIFFPVQAVLFLNQPEEDYTGGEFVLTEQVPRAQSRAIVLQPAKGDLLVFATSFRAARSTKGYYRAHMKHGVSEVGSGNRHTVGIIFHDAVS